MDSAVPVKGDTQVIRSILLGTAGLSVAALAALWLTVVRDCSDAEETAIRGAVRVGAAALLLQGAHFTEELITGFDERFPQLMGLTPWSPAFFVPFNVFWVIVWTLGLWGLRSRRRAALFPLWFLALGSMGNGLAHPALAAATGAYFPGLVTAPLVGIAGVLLARRLLQITAERSRTVVA